MGALNGCIWDKLVCMMPSPFMETTMKRIDEYKAVSRAHLHLCICTYALRYVVVIIVIVLVVGRRI